MENNYLTSLNSEQLNVVTSTEGPILVLAGPGSGKTKAITSRICYLIENNRAKPDEILAVTFTNKAAEEMRNRVESMNFGRPSWILTFHGACLRILREVGPQVGIKGRYTIINSNDSKTLLSSIIKSQDDEVESYELKNILTQISKVKNDGLTPYDDLGNIEDKFIKIYKLYQSKLEEINAVDFDDILLKTYNLLLINDKAREIARSKFKYLMVDEFQDTNNIQFKIISLLSGENKNVCVVGDEDQSIYSFRGSTPEIIKKFEKAFPTRKVCFLNTNYRSTNNIVQVCKKIIESNTKNIRPNIFTDNPDGEEVKYYLYNNDREEAVDIVNKIKISKGDNAILMRTNAQSRIFEEVLASNGQSYKIVGGLKFYDRLEVKDVLAYLSFIVNNRDELAFRRIVNTPKRGIGPSNIEKIINIRNEDGSDLYNASKKLMLTQKDKSKLKDGLLGFLNFVDSLSELIEYPEKLFKEIVESRELRSEYAKDEDSYEDRIENLGSLFSGFIEFLDSSSPLRTDVERVSDLSGLEQIQSYLESINLSNTDDEDELDKEKTYIMSVHASKGKEFDNVFVVGMENNLFPYKKKNERINVEEERRLFFVACSRAKKQLQISSCRERLLYGNLYKEEPSLLLDNIYDYVKVHINKPDPKYSYSKNINRENDKYDRVKKRKNIGLSESIDRLPENCKVGDRVLHPSFGEGVIDQITISDDTVNINFNGSVRVLKISLAPLKMIN